MWNSNTDQQIISKWRGLRADISAQPVEAQIVETLKFIAAIPYGARCLDYYSPDSWPTPWEILAHRQFCASSISLLAYHTLTMVSDIDLQLYLIDDGNDLYLVPVYGDMVLNFYPNELTPLDHVQERASVVKIYRRDTIRPIR